MRLALAAGAVPDVELFRDIIDAQASSEARAIIRLDRLVPPSTIDGAANVTQRKGAPIS
jgi:hypothetical protein